MSWTDSDLAIAKEMYEAGAGSTAIAEALKRTRNSIMGKMVRMGFKSPNIGGVRLAAGRPTGIKERRPRRRGQPAAKRVNNGNVFMFGSRKPKPATREQLHVADLCIPASQRRTFAQLGAYDCCWPVGEPGKPDFFFCGAARREDYPYCYAHCDRAYESGRDDLVRLVRVG